MARLGDSETTDDGETLVDCFYDKVNRDTFARSASVLPSLTFR